MALIETKVQYVIMVNLNSRFVYYKIFNMMYLYN